MWKNPKVKNATYCKISISHGHIFVETTFLVALFSGRLNFGRAYYQKELCLKMNWACLQRKKL